MAATAFLALLFAAAMAEAGDDVPRPEYPRPQFVRERWHNLNGTWTCELDLDEAAKAGQADATDAKPADRRDAKGFSRPITVPFCSESRLSGIGHTGFIPQIWYHRPLEIPADWNDRILLHFGGVDYHCECFIDGRLVGRHAGGQAGFAFDISPFVKPGGRHDLVISVRDDVRSGLQPAGKQSHALKSAGCRYTRVTGIWQTVWMEPVPRLGLRDVSIVPDFDRSRFSITPAYWAVAAGHTLRATLLDSGREVSSATVPQADGVPLALDVPDPKPWSPDAPHLYDLRLELLDPKGTVIDTVGSYAGLRKVHLENGRFHLNNRPIFLRLVLDQGYYPDGIWTAPTDAALRQGIELSQAAGFNGARLHQKVFEPRFHYWADRLGYLTWGEAASWGCNAATPEARDNFLREWREIVHRDRNHPSIIAWTPWNEVWATDHEEQVARTLRDTFALTRELDPTRPVHTSSGGAHVATDIFSVHCYEQTGLGLAAVLAAGEDATLAKVQRTHAEALAKAGLPFFVGEFGGIKWNTPGSGAPPENWGYGDAPKDKEAFLRRLDDLVNTVLAVPGCAGYCYTQLTDVEQEVNGIYTYDRREKFDMQRVRAAFSREPAGVAQTKTVPGTNSTAKTVPGTVFNMQSFIDAKLAAGAKRIVIPPGRYRVAAKNGTHLRFKGLTDVAIVADGVELVATSTCRIAVFDDCTNLSLRGLSVDFDPLPFTQGRIVALAPDKSWVEFEILDGYPENQLRERIEIFDPATGRLRRETAAWEPEIERVGDRRFRATKRHYRFQPTLDTEQVGDILVTRNCFPADAWGHAFDATRCRGLVLEDITLHAADCFGFVEHDCDGSTYRRCRIDRRSPEHDPVPRAVPRMRSLNADAFHSNGAAKGPTIDACTAKFQGDDCVNIHGTYHLVTAVDGPRLRIAVLGRPTIEPGDPVEFLPFTGPRPPDAVAASIVADPTPITDAEKDRIRPVSLNDKNKTRLLDGHAKFFTLTLDREVSLPPLSAVCSGNRVGNGFVIRDCDFGFNRSRGILIKASRGQVVGNTISHGWMAAVLVAPEYWWFESASASDVEIRDNTIVGCRRTAIEVVAQGGDGKPLPAGAHRGITITGNRIADSAWPNIFVTSTTDLVLADNELTPTETSPFTPPLQRPWPWNGRTPAPIVTEETVPGTESGPHER